MGLLNKPRFRDLVDEIHRGERRITPPLRGSRRAKGEARWRFGGGTCHRKSSPPRISLRTNRSASATPPQGGSKIQKRARNSKLLPRGFSTTPTRGGRGVASDKGSGGPRGSGLPAKRDLSRRGLSQPPLHDRVRPPRPKPTRAFPRICRHGARRGFGYGGEALRPLHAGGAGESRAGRKNSSFCRNSPSRPSHEEEKMTRKILAINSRRRIRGGSASSACGYARAMARSLSEHAGANSEFLKNCINSDKFTGFFDKFLAIYLIDF